MKKKSSHHNAAIVLLGTMSDASVAAFAGITAQAVQKWRKRRGIPAFYFRTHGKYAGRYQQYLSVLRAHPTGMRAVDVARELQVSRAAVSTMLMRLELRGFVSRIYMDGHKHSLWRVAAMPQSDNEEPAI